MASVILTMRGCRLVYLGSDTPVDQITTTARECEARAVALSVSAALPSRQASEAIAALRRALPRHTALWAGGAGVPKAPKGVERFETLAALDERLATRA
jgi:methanogenic corrinoid protein MtbC1